MTVEFHKLVAAISQARGSVRIVCADFDEELPASQLTLGVGLHSSIDKYHEIFSNEAQYIAARVISHSLVDDGRLVSQKEAEVRAAPFLDPFSHDRPRCWTNGEFLFFGNSSYLGKWMQVRPEIISCGALVVSRSRSGVLWIAEEIPEERVV